MSILDLTAKDISCEHCKMTIESTLGSTSGVRTVEVDVASKAVHVVYDDSETSSEAIRSKLDEVGYPTS